MSPVNCSKLHRGDRVKTLNKLSSACLGLCLASGLYWSSPVAAEVKLVETEGWTFSFDGRVNSFLSGFQGEDFPLATPGQAHTVMGFGKGADGVPDVGWNSNTQFDANRKLLGARVRSGLLGNILGFGLTKQVSDTLVVKGYVGIWSTIETLGRDKWAPINAEARVGYFTASMPWGSITAGRMLGLIGRTSYDIDVAYGHGYGLGLPCTDALGPACGHIGTGVLFPGYSAGFMYSSPVIFGGQLNLGIYDPVSLGAGATGDWIRTPYPRPEGALTLTRPFGVAGNYFHVGVEGTFQPLARTASTMDPTTNAVVLSNKTTSVWGVSGGARVEVGPLRAGASAFRGRGIGIGNALQKITATSDDDQGSAAPTGLTYGLRTFTGFYVQGGVLLMEKLHITAGYGMAMVDQLPVDKANPHLSVIHTQTGISGAIYYHVSDSVVLGIDFFHFKASWYGAPILDMNNQPTGTKYAGELQSLNFLNAGVTYHW
jgi:hypothetical protein